MYRTFNEFTGPNVQFFGSFLNLFLKIPGDRAGEMHREI